MDGEAHLLSVTLVDIMSTIALLLSAWTARTDCCFVHSGPPSAEAAADAQGRVPPASVDMLLLHGLECELKAQKLHAQVPGSIHLGAQKVVRS